MALNNCDWLTHSSHCSRLDEKWAVAWLAKTTWLAANISASMRTLNRAILHIVAILDQFYAGVT
jgi:hypothetical protein